MGKRKKLTKADREAAALRGIARAANCPPERINHGAVRIEDAINADGEPDPAAGRVIRFTDTSPIDAYLSRNILSPYQHDAAAWLFRTYRRAVSSGVSVANFNERVQSSPKPHTPVIGSLAEIEKAFLRSGLGWNAVEAEPLKVRLRNAPDAVFLPRATFKPNRDGEVAIAVCCFEEWAGGTRNIERLKRALDALADYLKIGKPKK